MKVKKKKMTLDLDLEDGDNGCAASLGRRRFGVHSKTRHRGRGQAVVLGKKKKKY